MLKRFKKVTALVLGATMIFASSLGAFADGTAGEDTSAAGTGQILDFKIVKQVVPTSLKLAINPNAYPINLRYNKVADTDSFNSGTKYYKEAAGVYSVDTAVTAENWDDKVEAGLYTADTSNSQIVTFNYGIANKSTVARKVAVKFAVTADEKVEFVDAQAKTVAQADAEDTVGAKNGEYKIYLTVVPAKAATTITTNTYAKAAAYTDENTEYYTWDDTNKKYVGPAKYADEDAFDAVTGTKFVATTTIGTEIMSSELGDVTMTPSTAPIAFAAGKGTSTADVAFSLPKATYTLKADEFIDFTTTSANVGSKHEMTGIGGISGFTVVGAMNTNTEWSQLTTKTITLTPTYEITDATGLEEAVATGLNQVKTTPANVAPSLTPATVTADGSENVVLTYTLGSGTLAATEIKSVTYSSVSKNVTDQAAATTFYSIDASAKTITLPADKLTQIKGMGFEDITFKFTFDNDESATCAITFE